MTSQWKPSATLETIRDRATLVAKVRRFFYERGVLEVETPSVSVFPAVDLHIDPLSVIGRATNHRRFLITSPEYHMKRLISADFPSIFQICKAFRQEESGANHNPEFTIIEWYRVGWGYWRLMDEVEALLTLLLKTGKADRVSYQELFETMVGLNPFTICHQQFLDTCVEREIDPPEYLKSPESPQDDWLNHLMGSYIERRLGLERPLFVYDYPLSQASLARPHPSSPDRALRFELYYKGLELANGFDELTEMKKQATRFEKENIARETLGKEKLPVDSRFLEALEFGLPDCSGVAMGFDRLVMLALNKTDIRQVLSFSWDHA